MEEKKKVRILRKLFINRSDAYGTRSVKDDEVWQVKNPLTDAILVAHLLGRKHVGVYSLTPDGKTKWVCVDIDSDDFVSARELKMQCQHYCLPVYLERSKNKGFHIWGFFQGLVHADKVRAVFKHILSEMRMETTELFPKQTHPRAGGFGNFVWLPLFGYLSRSGLAQTGRTVFVNDHAVPYPDQFDFLSNVKYTTELKLDEVIEINDLRLDEVSDRDDGKKRSSNIGILAKENGENSHFLAPPCLMQLMEGGVSEGLRNESCFRISIMLYRAGIPEELGRVMLWHWNTKNRPPLSEYELETAIQQGYSGHYNSYGCRNLEEYCNDRCPIYQYRKGKGWV